MSHENPVPPFCPYASVAQRIIARFGGVAALATLYGKPRSTVQHWADTGIIPEPHRLPLLELADAHGIDHSPFDYIIYMIPAWATRMHAAGAETPLSMSLRQ